jgi:hypothetical protein
MEKEPRTARERAVLLLRATFLPGWRQTASQRLVWAIRAATVLGVLAIIASAVDKSLWDWLDLLIVPVVLAIGGYLFNNSQNQATQRATEQRAQDDVLQAYLDQMNTLVLEKNLHNPDPDGVFKIAEGYEMNKAEILARARTLTVLRRLDPNRKAQVLQFLVEAALVQNLPERGRPVLSLIGADLQEAPLGFYDLHVINLDGADLTRADLHDANLSGASLSGADLSGADLGAATGITNEELEQQAKSLEGATMPNGEKIRGPA